MRSHAHRLGSLLWQEPAPAGAPPTLRRAAVYPVLLAVVIVLGINRPFLATAVESIDPVWLVAFRLIGGALTVLVVDPTRLHWGDTRVILGHRMLLGAAILNSSLSVYVRRHRWVASPLALLPWQLLVATVPMVIAALAVEGIPDIEWTGRLVAIVVYRETLASAFALWGQLTVLRSLPAINTNLGRMGVPVVGLFSSAILVDENLTLSIVAGLALVLLGVRASVLADAPTGPP